MSVAAVDTPIAPPQQEVPPQTTAAPKNVDITITRMTKPDVAGAVDSIQRAFADDPYSKWVFDRSKFSLPRNRLSLGTRCTWGIHHALFYVAKDAQGAVLGAAMWLPPALATLHPASDWRSTLSREVGAWMLWLQQGLVNAWYGRGGLNTTRYWAWKRAQAEAQSQLWTDDKGYYFCNIVTVNPECQGMGVGRKLVEEVMRKADAEGRCCYLESSRRVPNVRIYERMGFELVREMRCQGEEDDEGIVLFCMMRKPR